MFKWLNNKNKYIFFSIIKSYVLRVNSNKPGCWKFACWQRVQWSCWGVLAMSQEYTGQPGELWKN